ncbi:MAG: RNA polymerase sigma factor [Planctomycetota bacterium]|nr:RNA polymerase sigma factor [Planctomycetota bacterium]
MTNSIATQPADDTADLRMIRIQSGDTGAFDEIVDEHRGPLIGFFFKNLRDRELAEDMTQEVLLRVYNTAWDYLPSGRFKAWMYRIARNLLIDNIRRRTNDALVKALRSSSMKDEDADPLSWVAGSVLTPPENADHHELSELVDRLLDNVPEDQRLTFTLHHYAGLKLAEVAEAMESSVPTTKSRLRLAREKLQAQLKKHGITDPHLPDDTSNAEP